MDIALDGQVLLCRRETSNGHDPFAVTVIKDSVVVGHLCRANGSLRYSRDLPQGGLEVPCILYLLGSRHSQTA